MKNMGIDTVYIYKYNMDRVLDFKRRKRNGYKMLKGFDDVMMISVIEHEQWWEWNDMMKDLEKLQQDVYMIGEALDAIEIDLFGESTETSDCSILQKAAEDKRLKKEKK